MIKTCPRCGEKHSRSHAWCKECHSAYMKEWRKTHPPSEEQRRKGNARAYANVYLKRGKLERQPCEDCGVEHEDEPVQMHHEDYDRPLDVVWLCRGCHVERHDEEDHFWINFRREPAASTAS